MSRRLFLSGRVQALPLGLAAFCLDLSGDPAFFLQ